MIKILKTFPKEIYFLRYTEMWDLFSRIGIMVLLVFYLTRVFKLSDAKSFVIYGTFISLSYVTSLVGGILCDKFVNNTFLIITGNIMMLIGNFILFFKKLDLVYLGLSIIAVGSGLFLPSIVTLFSQIYDKNDKTRDAGFTLYYLVKNVAYLLAPILCGIVGETYGLNYAFIVSGIGMLSGLLVFLFAKNKFLKYETIKTKITIRKKIFSAIIILITTLITFSILVLNLEGNLLIFVVPAAIIYLIFYMIKKTKIEKKNVLIIFLLLFFVTVFSTILGQGGTTINLFIERIINRHFFSLVIPPEFFYSLDPFFMMIFGALLINLWLKLSKKKLEPNSITKLTICFFVFAIGFSVIALAALNATFFGKSSFLFIILAYALFPIAELLIMPITLSKITKLAPKDLKGFMISMWMLTSAISSYFTGIFSKIGTVNFRIENLNSLKKASHVYFKIFFISTIILIACGFLLLFLKRVFKSLNSI